MAEFDEIEDEIFKQAKKGNVVRASVLVQLHRSIVEKFRVEAEFVRGPDRRIQVEMTSPEEPKEEPRRCHPGCTRTDCDSAEGPQPPDTQSASGG